VLSVLKPHLLSGQSDVDRDARADAAARRSAGRHHGLGSEVCDDALTLTALMRRLNEQPYHILHFLGHGRFSPRAKTASLILEDETGAMQPAGDTEFAKQLKALQSPPHPRFPFVVPERDPRSRQGQSLRRLRAQAGAIRTRSR
jgi:hypothetical protein